MSYLTRFVDGAELKLINHDLTEAGYRPIEAGFVSNILNRYNANEKPEVEAIIAGRLDMPTSDVNLTVSRLNDLR